MFIHLHNHFIGSFNDSILKFGEALSLIKNDGANAIAMTEHNQLPLLFEFVDACVLRDVKPIIGCEFYFVEDAARSRITGDNFRNHIVLLAMNNRGIQNLIKLNNVSWQKNYFKYKKFKWGRGQIDWNDLEKYNEGLILLTGCCYGVLAYSANYQKNLLHEKLYKLITIFGNNRFFMELSYHGMKEEESANKTLIPLAKQNNIRCIVTQDAHYLNYEDYIPHNMLISTRFGKKTQFSYNSNEYYLKTEKQMKMLGFYQEFYKNTQIVADMVEYDLVKFRSIYKKFKVDSDHNTGINISTHLRISVDKAMEKVNYDVKISKEFIEKYKEIIERYNSNMKDVLVHFEKEPNTTPKQLDFITYISKLYDIPYGFEKTEFHIQGDPELLSSHIPVFRKQKSILTQFDIETLCNLTKI